MIRFANQLIADSQKLVAAAASLLATSYQLTARATLGATDG